MTTGPAADPAPQGILAVAGTATGVSITSLSPSDGSVLGERTFQIPEGVSAGSLPGGTAYLARLAFSPDYDRMTATTYLPSDGSEHVGWVDLDGNFVDVTAAIAGESSDFAGSTQHTSPLFAADGWFYFLDKQGERILRVDPSQAKVGLNAEVMMTGVVTPSFFVWPTGTILPCSAGCLPHIEYDNPEVYGYGGFVNDWLDGSTLICGNADRDQIYLYDPWSGPIPGGSWGCGENQRALLPETDRLSWNAVASPDGNEIAFLSSSGAGDSLPELFTVTRTGGSLESLPTSYSFDRSVNGWLGASNTLQIIDWLPMLGESAQSVAEACPPAILEDVKSNTNGEGLVRSASDVPLQLNVFHLTSVCALDRLDAWTIYLPDVSASDVYAELISSGGQPLTCEDGWEDWQCTQMPSGESVSVRQADAWATEAYGGNPTVAVLVVLPS